MSKTSIYIELGDKSKPPVKVKWFGSPSTAELNENICHVVGLAPGTAFQLLDSDGQPIVITPDLANETTLQLVVGDGQLQPAAESGYVERGLLDEPSGKLIKNLEKFKGWKAGERMLFADICQKLNIRMKEQDRVLVVTTEAVYNVDPSG